MRYKRLGRSFFARDTLTVAQELLGKLLVRRWRNATIIGRIVEVESYVGTDDAACHASHGRTPRTELMFGRPGHAYVYLIYGMYHCLNIVTEKSGFPAAVLIRSLEPIARVPAMQKARHTNNLLNLTTGPGKLTQAFYIRSNLNGEDLTTSQGLYVAHDGYVTLPNDIQASTRIGVDYAGKSAKLPWRYFLGHSPYVSHSK